MASEIAISQLPSVVTPALTDVLPEVQSGETYKISLTQLQELFNITSSSLLTLSQLQLSNITLASTSTTSAILVGSNTITYTASSTNYENFTVEFQTFATGSGSLTDLSYTAIGMTPNPTITGNGTFSNFFGILIRPVSFAMTQYSAYFAIPTGGTLNVACYVDNLSVGNDDNNPPQGTIATAPPNSSVVTTAFGTSLTLGTSIQNTTGYDLVVNILIAVSAATTATLTLGVGITSTPTTDTAVPSTSVTGDYNLHAYVPAGYYLLVGSTGTITATGTLVAMAV